MKGTAIFRKLSVFGLLVGMTLVIVAFSQTTAYAGGETARVVKYSQDDIVTVHAKLRYSTLIVLPENEEILDFTTGDNDFWIINGAHNLCYIHPAEAGIRSNLNLITASGHVYSFLLEEISNEPNAEPDLKIFIEPKEQSGNGMDAFAGNVAPTSEVDAYQREIQGVRDQAASPARAAAAGAKQHRGVSSRAQRGSSSGPFSPLFFTTAGGNASARTTVAGRAAVRAGFRGSRGRFLRSVRA